LIVDSFGGGLLFKYIIFIFFIELFISLKVGIEIGFLGSVIWILGSMLFGLYLLKYSQHTLAYGLQKFGNNHMGLQILGNSAISYFFGAILLIIPGVLSDFIGLFLLGYVLYLHLFVKIPPRKSQYYEGDIDVIDTEIIDEPSSSDKLDKSRSF
jgi:UPF0716 family protein affecting phage T7 exclusion